MPTLKGRPLSRVAGVFGKVRWATAGRGNRGGVRTIYFFYAERAAIYLLTVYAKAEEAR